MLSVVKLPDTDRATWDFLADTYWYVTPPDLPALQFSPDEHVLAWRGDQTVWHISGSRSGYFWGVTSALTFELDEADGKRAGRPRQLSLVGTVTAGGQVQITFIRGKRLSESVTTGFGQMVRVGEEWAFQMQMSTASGEEQLLHWANMRQTKEGDASWQKLPGVDRSVPEMLEGATYPTFARE
jgi:hypothetical protein